MTEYTDDESTHLETDLNSIPSSVEAILHRKSAQHMLQDIVATCGPHQRAILDMLAISQIHNVDLNLLLDDFLPELPRSYQPAVTFVQAQLNAGKSLVEALSESPQLLPTRSVAVWQMATDNQTLLLLCSEILEQRYDSAHSQNRYQVAPKGCLHAIGVSLLATVVTVYIILKIVPQLKDLLEEFGSSPPFVFDWLISAIGYFGPLLLLCGLLSTPILFPVLLSFLRSWDPHNWLTQHSTAATQRRQTLAAFIDQSDTSTKAIDSLDKKMNSEATGGNRSWIESLGKPFATDSEKQALATAASSETQAWLLRWFAATHQNRSTKRSANWSSFIVIAVNVLVGGITVLSALAIYSVLISIMNEAIKW